MSWQDILDTEINPGKPPKSSIFYRLRDNLVAVAQRMVGAPVVQVPVEEWITTTGAFTWNWPDGVTAAEVIAVGGGAAANGDGAATTVTCDAFSLTANGGNGGTAAVPGTGGTGTGGYANLTGGTGSDGATAGTLRGGNTPLGLGSGGVFEASNATGVGAGGCGQQLGGGNPNFAGGSGAVVKQRITRGAATAITGTVGAAGTATGVFSINRLPTAGAVIIRY